MIKKVYKYVLNQWGLKAIYKSIIHSTQLSVIIRDIFHITQTPYSNNTHIQAAIDWLCKTQDHSGSYGSSGSFSFDFGWAPPYPETTGYIIQTLLRFTDFTKDVTYFERVKKMGDWEIDIQLLSGAVRGGAGINDYPVVFNTGMVILGWTDLYGKTGSEKYLSAARKAADWLCSVMDSDGKWSQFTYLKIPHAYHSRVSWSLLEVYKHTKDEKYRNAAMKNINWVLSLVKENGWIDEMHMVKGEYPLTHTIAYTLRGLLECSFHLNDVQKIKIQNTVIQAAEILAEKYEIIYNKPSPKPKFLAARYNEEWQPVAKYSCLTGNAQMAIIWLKLFQINGNNCFLDAATKLLGQLKKVHDLNSNNPGIRGGIAGSYPIWGSYMRFSYPNWAAKFFADGLMLLQTITNRKEHK